MPFPTHTSPILHLSLVWQGFLKVEDFVSDLQLFPWNKFLFTKISHYHGNYREAPKMYLFFLYSTYSRVTANGHRNYIKNYFQGRERATHPLCHSFLSILVCHGGRLNGQTQEENKTISTDSSCYFTDRERLSSGCVCPVSGAGERRGSGEKRNRKQMGDEISQNSQNSEEKKKTQTSLVAWRLGQKWGLSIVAKRAQLKLARQGVVSHGHQFQLTPAQWQQREVRKLDHFWINLGQEVGSGLNLLQGFSQL